MSKCFFTLLLLPVLFFSSCKKAGDDCIVNFVGDWHGSVNTGSCNGSFGMEIKPGGTSCEVQFPSLPSEGCHNSSYLVLGNVVGDSVFISSQPFGLNTVTAQGAVYLNQFTMEVNSSNGFHAVLSLTK